MNIYEINKFANSLNQSNLAFKTLNEISMSLERAKNAVFPYWADYYKNMIPQMTMFKEIATPYLMRIGQEQQRISKIFMPQLEIIARLQHKMYDIVIPQIALASEAMRPMFELKEKVKNCNFQAIYDKWEQIAKVLAKQQVNSILLENYWLIMDQTLFDELIKNSLDDKFAPNKHIISYYSNHKFANIELVLNQMKRSNCLKNEQIEIFEDCYSVMKKLSCKVACNTLIPTLMAQSDGLLSAICEIIPESDKEAILKEKDKSKNSTALIIQCYLEQLNLFNTTEQFKTVIKDNAFGKPKKNSTYKKSRHKILHGKCSYGSKENLVRCWLENAFLIKVYCIILAKQQEKEVA